MRLVLLTSDIIEARIVLARLIKKSKDIKAVIYEPKKKSLKTFIKLWGLFILRKIRHIRMQDAALDFPEAKIKATANINEKDNVELLKEIRPDLIVVLGTRRLRREVFSCAAVGTINLHGGILPYYRGADSAFWALYHNEPDKIGVTVHFVTDTLDAGDIIAEERLAVTDKDTARTLRDRIMFLEAEKLIDALALIESGEFQRTPQEVRSVRPFRSATQSERAQLPRRISLQRKRPSAVKEFGGQGLVTTEIVARKPLIELSVGSEIGFPRIFSLRIDADEYDGRGFRQYLPFFRKYAQAITLFVNAHQFYRAQDEIKECSAAGVDVQSHGFYHHIYCDYKSNRYNIAKAKSFFQGMGIETRGFAAPMGSWNTSLMQALEDEGYLYSTDFSYDYLGLPSYPWLHRRASKVLEVPIFPVAPDKFLKNGQGGIDKICKFYTFVIDEMVRCAIPAIIYGHPLASKENLELLSRITEYAVFEKRLTPCTMTDFADQWKSQKFKENVIVERKTLSLPHSSLLGWPVSLGISEQLKLSVKKLVDFERITPGQELVCPWPSRILKKTLRSVLKAPSQEAGL